MSLERQDISLWLFPHPTSKTSPEPLPNISQTGMRSRSSEFTIKGKTVFLVQSLYFPSRSYIIQFWHQKRLNQTTWSFYCFFGALLFASLFPLAKQVWLGICGSSCLVGFCGFCLVLIDLPAHMDVMSLYKRLSCSLCSCKDRAFSAISATLVWKSSWYSAERSVTLHTFDFTKYRLWTSLFWLGTIVNGQIVVCSFDLAEYHL